MTPETKEKLKKIFPPLGMRIVKTALALFVAMVISDYVFKRFMPDLNTNSVCVFAILSVQDSVRGTRRFIFERFLGNVLGLGMGFLFLLLFNLTGTKGIGGDVINGNFMFYAFIAVGSLITIYLCKVLHRVSASVITILVFLGIMFGAGSEMNQYLHGAYTVLQMTLGIVIAVAINLLIMPPKAKPECPNSAHNHDEKALGLDDADESNYSEEDEKPDSRQLSAVENPEKDVTEEPPEGNAEIPADEEEDEEE